MKQYSNISKFALGQTVYIKNEDEQVGRTVVGIDFSLSGGIYYNISYSVNVSVHTELELSNQIDVEKRLGLSLG